MYIHVTEAHEYENNNNPCKVIPEYIKNSVHCNSVYFHESGNGDNIVGPKFHHSSFDDD